MSAKKIKDDEHYFKAHKYAVELAEELDDPDPLADKEELRKKNYLYNRTIELLQEYNRGRWVQLDPSRAKHYESLGLNFQRFE